MEPEVGVVVVRFTTSGTVYGSKVVELVAASVEVVVEIFVVVASVEVVVDVVGVFAVAIASRCRFNSSIGRYGSKKNVLEVEGSVEAEVEGAGGVVVVVVDISSGVTDS